MTNKHQLLFHFFSSLRHDPSHPHSPPPTLPLTSNGSQSTSTCCFDGIFEHECKNRLNGEQSESNIWMRSYWFYFLIISVKVKPKLRELNEAPPHPPPYRHHKARHALQTQQQIALWEKRALSTHYVKICLFVLLMKDWVWMIRMWCLNKTPIPSSELTLYDHSHTHTDT